MAAESEYRVLMKHKGQSSLHVVNCANNICMEGHDENQIVCRTCKKRVVAGRERSSITWVSTRRRDEIKTGMSQVRRRAKLSKTLDHG